MTVKNKTNESGRSMVEMLGVLAIIGVLSVAGVAGYKAAVRKSLANNLLNQASMRATDVATKIASGNLDALDSDVFAGNLGGGVTMSSAVKGADGYADYDESDEQFTLSMEGLDEEMCQQMQSMGGGSRSVVRAVLCDGDKAILTFNKDLSSNPVSSDFDGNKEGCESSGRKYCDNDTCIPATEECPTEGSGEGFDSGICENGNPYLSFMEGFGDDPCKTQLSGVSCSSDEDCTDQYGTEGCCHSEKKVCIARDIYDSDTDTYSCPQFNCIKNSDCANGEFCNLKSHMTEEPLAPAYGTCQSIGEVKEAVFEDSGETYYYSIDLDLSWWGAENWCKAQGLSMTEFPMEVWGVCRGTGKEAYERCMSEFPNLFSPPVYGSFWMGLCDNYEGCFRLHPIGDNPIKEVPRNQTYNAICQSL